MNEFNILKNSSWPEYDLKVTLKPCFRCNQQCWFCNEYDNKTHMWTETECLNVINKLTTIPDRYKKIFIYLYGGEPTLTKNWELIHTLLFKHLHDKELYIQTQTNLSINYTRLKRFLTGVCKTKPEHHTVNICSSYHIGMQSVDDFISKMKLCDEYDTLGLCFFSTEIGKEEQMINDFDELVSVYPDKIKMKFTVIPKLRNKNIEVYQDLLKDQDLLGDDDGQYIEYRYLTKKYPQFLNYLEESWTFNMDGREMNYVDVKHERVHENFKYMHCECGRKSIVIDHNLVVYRCNDDSYNNINPTNLDALDLSTYLNKDAVCLNSKCWDGLDFRKYKK